MDFPVLQDRCHITFKLPAKTREMYEKRGIIKGYMVHVEPPFPDGQVWQRAKRDSVSGGSLPRTRIAGGLLTRGRPLLRDFQ